MLLLTQVPNEEQKEFEIIAGLSDSVDEGIRTSPFPGLSITAMILSIVQLYKLLVRTLL